MELIMSKKTSIGRVVAVALIFLSLFLAGCSKSETQAGTAPVVTETIAQAVAATVPIQEEKPTATTTPPVEAIEESFVFEGDLFGTGAVGRNGAAACASPIASQIAVDILKKGGNAVDAAVAMIYAVGLLEPAATGIGGAGQMVIYLADTDEYVSIEYMTQAPGAAVTGVLDTSTSDNPPSVQGLAIPGVVHGTLSALAKYGTMTPREVLQPVVDLARNGFPVTSRWNANIEGRYQNLSAYEYTLNLYTDDGFLWNEGDVITNDDLADTLELIADHGIDGFYNSDFTQKMVDYIQSIGGVLTREDFAQYKSVERDAISTTYRGYTVYTTTGPSNGGAPLLEMLNIAENFDLAGYGFDSPETVGILADAYAMAYQDGVAYIADPDYYNIPVAEMTSKEYAAQRAKSITPGSRIKTARAGKLSISLSETGKKIQEANTPDQGGTSHMVCADSMGNVVSTTNTNGINFGSAVAVPGTGFVFNAHLSNLSNTTTARANQLMPYIRVRSTTCPTIVADENGKPVLAVGSPGNWALVSAAFNAIVNFVDFDMNSAQAALAPRSWRDGISKEIYIEGRYSDDTQEGLKNMGFELIDNDLDYSSHVGCIAAVQIADDGLFYAIGDDRRHYGAAAY